MKLIPVSFNYSTILLSALTIASCDHPPLERLKTGAALMAEKKPVGKVIAEFSSRKSLQVISDLHLIFLIDTSGSNQRIFDGVTELPGSDPLGDKRFQPLVSFVTQFERLTPEEQQHVFWTMITFDDDARRVPTSGTDFTTDLSGFKQIVSDQRNNLRDQGATNYVAALDKARQIIGTDIAARNSNPLSQSAEYFVFHFTDGEPKVVVGGEEVLQDLNQQIGPKITELMTLSNQGSKTFSVTLNEGFYCNTLCDRSEGARARGLLKEMAKRGNGQFFEFRDSEIDFNVYTLPIRQTDYYVREVFVKNRNVAWHNGIPQLDSDRDGLSDEYELTVSNTDPSSSDSDGDGIPDMVQQLISGDACFRRDASGKCLSVSAPRYQFCARWRLPGTKIRYMPSSDPNLDRCSLSLLGFEPDSGSWNNGNWIPFSLVAWNQLSFDFRSGDAQLNPMGDGISNYFKVKYGLDPYTWYEKNVLKYDYILTSLGVSSDKKNHNYRLEVSNITLVTSDLTDTIAIYIGESASGNDTRQYLRVGEKAFDGNLTNSGGIVLKFKTSDFR